MNSENPGVFKNEGEIKEPNQGYFKINYFSELLKRQEEVNASLLRSLRDVKLNNNQQEFIQDKRWKEMNQQLEIGRASCREREEIGGGMGHLKDRDVGKDKAGTHKTT